MAQVLLLTREARHVFAHTCVMELHLQPGWQGQLACLAVHR